MASTIRIFLLISTNNAPFCHGIVTPPFREPRRSASRSCIVTTFIAATEAPILLLVSNHRAHFTIVDRQVAHPTVGRVAPAH